ncbi:hypothetical protein [Schlesneria paludicola]|uniref:hypothetical protein n=1 Tax=Schlesneria paludicola TaxID=360056 RepID=UPI00029B2C01|nr:hypothetical protein [Schlesneria paludicola]
MFSCALTLIFYAAGCLLLMKRSSAWSTRLLAIGGLPAVWISICASAGLLDTLLGLPPWLTLGLVVVASIVKSAKTTSVTAKPSVSAFNWLSCAALVVAGVCFIALAAYAHSTDPWGGWDTLFTWIMRARFFSLGGSQWNNTFSNDLALLHPDYPPMLSWALHALWRVDGQISSLAVIALFDPICLAFVSLVFGFQAISTERLRLGLSTAVVLAMPILWKLAVTLLADFALSYAILGSCAYYAYAVAKEDKHASSMSGFLAAWCGLIKNEGAVWFVAFMAVIVSVSLLSRLPFRRRLALNTITGAAIPLSLCIAFKVMLAPPSDLINPTRCFEIGNIVQPGILISPGPLIVRLDQTEFFLYHWPIWSNLYGLLWDYRDWGIALWWSFYLLITRFRRPGPAAPLLVAIGFQLAMYYGVYLITPYLPWWHISNSLSRILAHVIPAALCLMAFDTNPPPVIRRKSQQVVVQENAFVPRSAAVYLIAVSVGTLYVALQGHWNLGKLPPVNAEALRAIELPPEPVISYVSYDLGTRDFYSTQFAAVPAVLVLDRRESTLLARFPDEAELRRYCERHQWELMANQGGLGWARDKGGKELRQPVEVPRAW